MKAQKNIAIVLGVVLLTVSAMAAMMVEKKKVIGVCRDVRLAMDGAVGVTLTRGGLKPETYMTVFKNITSGKPRWETVNFSGGLTEYHDRLTDVYYNDQLKLVWSKEKNDRGIYPGNLEAVIDGKKTTVRLTCSK